MVHSRGGVLAVVALLVLVGCGGVVGPAGASAAADGPAATDDAAAVGDPVVDRTNGTAGPANDSTGRTGPIGDEDLPPGVTRDGVADADALVAAHRQALAESGFGFVLETNLSSAFAGGVEQWAVQNGSVEAGLSPFRFTTVSRLRFENESASPAAAVTDAWGNDSMVVVRTRRGNATQVQRIDRGPGDDVRLDPGGPGTDPGVGTDRTRALESLLTQTTVIETVLRSGRFEVSDIRQEGGRTLVELDATGLNETAFGGGNVSTFDASLLVDGDGRVLRLDYDLAFEPGQGPSVRYRYRVTDLGSATVERPPWVEEAFEPIPGNGSEPATDASAVIASGSKGNR